MNCNECEYSAAEYPAKIAVGYANVPFQRLGRVYTPEKAITRGTIFPELDIGIGEYERGLYDGK